VGGNYVTPLLAAAEAALANGTVQGGKFYHIDTRHDDWCDLLAGKGPCNCDPEIGEPYPHEGSRWDDTKRSM
jgi:hypothetical protein